jgi:hypothetical protein
MLAQDKDLRAPLHSGGQPDSASPAARFPGPGSDKARLTPKRPWRQVENEECGAFVRRVVRACSCRVGDGDAEVLIFLVGLAGEIDAAMAEAVKGLRAHGCSWTGISARLGISGQAAQQRGGASHGAAAPGSHPGLQPYLWWRRAERLRDGREMQGQVISTVPVLGHSVAKLRKQGSQFRHRLIDVIETTATGRFHSLGNKVPSSVEH